MYNCIVYKMAMTGMSQFPGREADYRFGALLSLEKMSEGPPVPLNTVLVYIRESLGVQSWTLF